MKAKELIVFIVDNDLTDKELKICGADENLEEQEGCDITAVAQSNEFDTVVLLCKDIKPRYRRIK